MRKIYTLLMATLCLAAVSCKQQPEKNTNIKYRPLGNTGLMVSEISIGCGGFGKIDSAASLELMTVALDSGMNYIDIYDANPKTRSNIGYALQGRRDEIIIQGHIGIIYKNGQHSRTRNMEETRQGFEDLLTRLGTDHIEVGMIHIADSRQEWEELENSAFLEYVLQLKEEGKIKHIGISSHNTEVALLAAKSGWIEVIMFSMNLAFDRLQSDANPWDKEAMKNLQAGIDPMRMELYDYCTSHNIAITVMKTFGGGGRLLDVKTSPLGIAYTPEQCIAYCLAKPCVATCILGIDNLEELKADLHWIHATEAEKDYNTVATGNNKQPSDCTYCNHCSPCAVGIPIAKVTELLDKVTTDGLTPELQAQYDALPHHAGECTDCGACLRRCPFDIDIQAKMDKAKEIFGK